MQVSLDKHETHVVQLTMDRCCNSLMPSVATPCCWSLWLSLPSVSAITLSKNVANPYNDTSSTILKCSWWNFACYDSFLALLWPRLGPLLQLCNNHWGWTKDKNFINYVPSLHFQFPWYVWIYSMRLTIHPILSSKPWYSHAFPSSHFKIIAC